MDAHPAAVKVCQRIAFVLNLREWG